MTRDELQEAVAQTLDKIMKLKVQITQVNDLREKKKLKRQLRELQYLQLTHIGQMEHQKG